MDVGRSISYIFQDPDWIKKTAIGGLLLLIPILGQLVVYGYWLRNLRRVATGDDLPLPEWDDFGGDFILGLKGFVVGFVWFLPVIVLSFCAITPISAFSDTNDAAGAAASGLVLALYCISFLLQLVIAFVIPLAFGRLAVTNELGPAFDFSGIIATARQYPTPLLIAVGMYIALTFAASFGVILCIIGVLFTTFLAFVMLSHLYGQIQRIVSPGTPNVITTEPMI